MEHRYDIGDILHENGNYFLIEDIQEGMYLWRHIGCTHDRSTFKKETGSVEIDFIDYMNGVTKVA